MDATEKKIRIRNLVNESEDPNPDPYQNVTDPEHCIAKNVTVTLFGDRNIMYIKVIPVSNRRFN